MKIYIGADHNGYQLKSSLIKYLSNAGYDVVDEGDKHNNPEDDFPMYTAKVIKDMMNSEDSEPRGILICGSGQGMCMAANRYKGIRASLGYDRISAQESRNDDDSNVLCLPASVLKKDQANQIVEIWLETPFAAAPRFVRRIKEIDDLI